jgi:hypothetical protein
MNKAKKGKKRTTKKRINRRGSRSSRNRDHDEHREYKEYAVGGGDYVRVYKPINPIEEIVGGKVKFIQRRR